MALRSAKRRYYWEEGDLKELKRNFTVIRISSPDNQYLTPEAEEAVGSFVKSHCSLHRIWVRNNVIYCEVGRRNQASHPFEAEYKFSTKGVTVVSSVFSPVELFDILAKDNKQFLATHSDLKQASQKEAKKLATAKKDQSAAQDSRGKSPILKSPGTNRTKQQNGNKEDQPKPQEKPSESNQTPKAGENQENRQVNQEQQTCQEKEINRTENGNDEQEQIWTLVKTRKHPAKTAQRRAPAPRPARTDVQTLLIRPSKEGNLNKIPQEKLAKELIAWEEGVIEKRWISKGGIAVDLPKNADLTRILAITTFCETTVEITRPADQQNRSAKGTILGQFDSTKSLEMQYHMEPSNPPIHNAKRLGKTNVYQLNFQTETLPSKVCICKEFFEVRPFIPGPVRCVKCQRYNHFAKDCRGTLTCSLCARQGHTWTECTVNQKRCANCGRNHPSTAKNCSHRLFELEAAKTAEKQQISRKQARYQTALSYADAARRNKENSRPEQMATEAQVRLPPTQQQENTERTSSPYYTTAHDLTKNVIEYVSTNFQAAESNSRNEADLVDRIQSLILKLLLQHQTASRETTPERHV